MITGKVVVFNEATSIPKFRDGVPKEYKITLRSATKEDLLILDSFDGRLFNAGFILRFSNNMLYLISITNQKDNQSFSWNKSALPQKSEDFKNTAISKIIKSNLGIRSLIPQLNLHLQIREFDIKNTDDKIIARGHFVTTKTENLKPARVKTFCFLKPVRGYSGDMKKITAGWPAYSAHSVFESALLDMHGIDLNTYTKPDFKFTDDTSLAKAFKSILSESFNIMRKNEQGIIEDIDIEFLHDYRVSGRRIRSALGLIKNVLEQDITEILIADLKKISRTSGPLRDLDVYLLREGEYKNLLPSDWAVNEIHTIFVNLKRRRKTAHRNMSAMLQSDYYTQMMVRWEAFFNEFDRYVVNDPPLIESASSLILQRYQKVVKKGKKLSSKSPDEAFHRLRIHCKKLRYLLEFFSSLYPQEDISLAIKQLKKIQDNLGDFNDLSVQIDTLNPILEKAESSGNQNLVKDLAGLIAVLNYKKTVLRQDFYGLFNKFTSGKNTTLYRRLFGGEQI